MGETGWAAGCVVWVGLSNCMRPLAFKVNQGSAVVLHSGFARLDEVLRSIERHMVPVADPVVGGEVRRTVALIVTACTVGDREEALR